jgi:predicted SAM-dependent methyltransferase
MPDDRERLHAYFDEVAVAQERLRSSKSTDSRLRRLTKNAVPPRFRGTVRMMLTDLSRPIQRRRLSRITTRPGALFVHLGSGGEPKSGWVNIDFVGDPVEVAWNLAHGIPFDDESVDAIFHEHLFEHISLEQGAALMDECFRVLKPGGIVRVGVPDAGELLRSYLGDGAYVELLHPHRPSRLIGVQELFYWHRHTAMYDNETLALQFRAGGFPDPQPRKFGDSDLEQAPDTERRRDETLYMEARKPTSAEPAAILPFS